MENLLFVEFEIDLRVNISFSVLSRKLQVCSRYVSRVTRKCNDLRFFFRMSVFDKSLLQMPVISDKSVRMFHPYVVAADVVIPHFNNFSRKCTLYFSSVTCLYINASMKDRT